ncbi:MAG: dihydroorotate dehydrogenase electron transfer subunit [Muribaculaceae bacterium]|nr:dihydroorotate dehydrogenase electron transfer subunit [Muribaculaceae bacterium]
MPKVHRKFSILRKLELEAGYFLLDLSPVEGVLPEDIQPGQFVEISVPDHSKLLRRPISIHFADYKSNILRLLIRVVGEGTKAVCSMSEGDSLDIILPLGKGFSTEFKSGDRVILVGGGVGVAPLLYQAALLKDLGVDVRMVYGARNSHELVVAEAFKDYAELEITTDDGSCGTPGRVTDSLCFATMLESASMVQCCGPAPMMKAVAAVCRDKGTPCEVSLENMMACGLGACLCCVEKTVKGNVCVCTEGPVFNIDQLTW